MMNCSQLDSPVLGQFFKYSILKLIKVQINLTITIFYATSSGPIARNLTGGGAYSYIPLMPNRFFLRVLFLRYVTMNK